MSRYDARPVSRVWADLGQGLVEIDGDVSWSVSRTLSGSGLPGQARATSGSSVGSGSIEVLSGNTPWTPQAIAPGGAVRIEASPDVDEPLRRRATMIAPSIDAGSALSDERSVSIEDDLRGLLDAAPLSAYLPAAPVDLSTVISSIATRLGLPHDVQPSGVLVASVRPEGRSAWDVIQWVAKVTLGAGWLDENGTLVYRGPAAMRGQGTVVETIYTLEDVEDLPWEISTDEVADRVEVTYTPVLVERSTTQTLDVWEGTEVIEVAGGATVTFEQDLDVVVSGLAPWRPVWDTSVAAERFSRWAASTDPEGGGTQPSSSALSITSTLLSGNRVRISVHNTTSVTLYVSGGRDTQRLLLRADGRATTQAAVTLASGADADSARSTTSLDLGVGIASEAQARSILAWLAAPTAAPAARLSGINVIPSAERHLGFIVEVLDPVTQANVRCVVSGIRESGSDGVYDQSLDLTIVDPTAPAPPTTTTTVTGGAGISTPGGISAFDQARRDEADRTDMSQPSVPSAPTLAARLGVLSITWDGLSNTGGAVSSNLSHVEVALGSTTGPTTVIDRIERGGGTVHVSDLPYNALRYVRLRGVSRNNIASAWGPERSQQVTPLVNADLIGQVIAEANLGDNVVTARTIISGAVTTAKLDALAVTADKIAANAITADKILAGQVTGTKIAGDAIDGKTITGATLRTAASGQRVQIDAAGLRAFNSGGTAVTTISASTGQLAATGSLSTTGPTGTTSVEAGYVRSVMSGMAINLQGTGLFFEAPLGSWIGQLAPQVGGMSLMTAPGKHLYVYAGGFTQGGIGGGTSKLGLLAGSGGIEIATSGNVDLFSNDMPQMYFRADTNGPFVSVDSIGYRNYQPGDSNVFVTANQNGTLAAWASGTATTPGDLTSSGRLIANSTLRSIGFESTSAAASCVMTTGGWLQRSTSLAAAKVAVEDLVLDGIAVTRALRPRTWHDRGSSERLADGLDRQARGEDVDWDDLAIEYPERIPGFIAEEVAALDLPAGFATRDPDGNLSGLAYDRIPAIHTIAIQQLADLVDDLSARLVALEGSA